MSGIMWGMELVEGKDAPHAGEHPKPKHNNLGCEFWNPFLEEALLLCWIVASVS